MREAARAQLPEYPATTDAVLLLNDGFTTIKDNGEIVTVVRQAYKILRPEGRRFAVVDVPFDSETKLTFLKAWSLGPKGDYEVKEKEAFETAPTGVALYADNRVKHLVIPGADPGVVVGFEYEQKHRPYLFEDSWWPQSSIPVRQSRYTIKLPQGWEYAARWTNWPNVEAVSSGANQWTWEMRDIPGIEAEPQMPAIRALAARLVITYYPTDPALRAKSWRDWRDIARWYSGLSAGRRSVTPQIKQKVAELTAGKTSQLEKVRALAEFVQNDVRYVAIEVGIGGFQPHAAEDVFSNRYGDCKDKVTLLSAMLNEIGVTSHYVLVHTARGIADPKLPSPWSFNHAILAAELKDLEAPNLYAVSQHPALGRVLYFDPTDDMTPLGSLPSSLQANRGLLVYGDGGELVDLPTLSPNLNRLLRVARVHLGGQGTIAAEVREIRSGSHAKVRRAQLRRLSEPERPKLVERFLGSFLPNFSLQSSKLENVDTNSGNLIVDYSFMAPNYAKAMGNLLLVRPRIVGGKGDDILEGKERKFPVEFDQPTLESDIVEIILPEGWEVDELPQPVQYSTEFADYKSKIEVEGRVLRYSRDFTVKQVLVPKEKLAELKKLYRHIAADERSSAVLRRATSTASVPK